MLGSCSGSCFGSCPRSCSRSCSHLSPHTVAVVTYNRDRDRERADQREAVNTRAVNTGAANTGAVHTRAANTTATNMGGQHRGRHWPVRTNRWRRSVERDSSVKFLLGAKLSKFLDEVLRNTVGGRYIASRFHLLS